MRCFTVRTWFVPTKKYHAILPERAIVALRDHPVSVAGNEVTAARRLQTNATSEQQTACHTHLARKPGQSKTPPIENTKAAHAQISLSQISAGIEPTRQRRDFPLPLRPKLHYARR
jgi:hypothetical protein